MISSQSDYKYTTPTADINYTLPIMPQRDVNNDNTARCLYGVDIAFLLEACAELFQLTNDGNLNGMMSNEVRFHAPSGQDQMQAGFAYSIYMALKWAIYSNSSISNFIKEELPTAQFIEGSLPITKCTATEIPLYSSELTSLVNQIISDHVLRADYLRYMFYILSNLRRRDFGSQSLSYGITHTTPTRTGTYRKRTYNYSTSSYTITTTPSLPTVNTSNNTLYYCFINWSRSGGEEWEETEQQAEYEYLSGNITLTPSSFLSARNRVDFSHTKTKLFLELKIENEIRNNNASSYRENVTLHCSISSNRLFAQGNNVVITPADINAIIAHVKANYDLAKEAKPSGTTYRIRQYITVSISSARLIAELNDHTDFSSIGWTWKPPS